MTQYVEAFNHGDPDALRAPFTPDAVGYRVLGSGGMAVAAYPDTSCSRHHALRPTLPL